MNWLGNAKQLAVNLPGWRTKRKIIVIQSDDWGSIRMPSIEVRERLDKHALIEANDAYCYYDTLETEDDLTALYEILSSVKDKDKNSAVITANCLMANPDFDAIRKSNFQEYFYEPLEKTFERYNNIKALKLWDEGNQKGLFIPQYHGREHVNATFWMSQLRSGHEGVHAAFDREVFGVNFKGLPYRKSNLQAAWDFRNEKEEEEVGLVILDGIRLFNAMFEKQSVTATAPSYVWSSGQERILMSEGVKILQGTPYQLIPNGFGEKYRKKFRYTQHNVANAPGFQMRNVFFEPTLQPGLDVVDDCLKRISNAFLMGKPAIIGSHRLNFIGGLVSKNRDSNLMLLQKLLKSIVKKWPQVEFVSSDQLFGG